MEIHELTGPRARILRVAWWGVLLAGLWLSIAWPFEAHLVVPHCSPETVHHVGAGNWLTLVMGLLGLVTAALVLFRGDALGHAAGAGTMCVALLLGFVEWVAMSTLITHRCGADVTAAWFASPTRDAALVLTFAGPFLFVLGRVLRWLEARRTDHIPPAQARP